MTDWRPSAMPGALQQRAALLARLRAFFQARGVMEVETPLLSRAGNSDTGIEQWPAGDSHWLRTSPEYAMKRLLAAGQGDVYELGRVFRRGEEGRWHNPEFTLLEWYRVGWTYQDLAREVVEIIHEGQPAGQTWPVQWLSYRDALLEGAGVDPFEADRAELAAAAESAGVNLAGQAELDRDGWLDLLMSHQVQPGFPERRITVVLDYPASQAALSRVRKEDGQPDVAERFEVFLGPIELANGYQELTDAAEQRARFEQEQLARRDNGQILAPLDEALLAALDHGLPECAGVALGVDRLLLAEAGLRQLSDGLAFSHRRT